MSIVISVKADTDSATGGVKALRVELDGVMKAGTDAGTAISKGAREGSTSMDKLKASTHGATTEISALVAAGAAFASVSKLEHITDAFIEVGNRIRSVAQDQANFNGLMDATFDVAQRSRSDWEATAATFQRFSIATRSLGLSQREVLTLTEDIAKASRLSGASTREAQMAQMELAHSFQTGTLTGREFKVLMKDAPVMMEEIRRSLMLAGPQFAEMGKHGKLSAEMITDGFSKAHDSINEKFAKLIPTISEGIAGLHNAAVKFFGEAANGSGVLSMLATAMQFVANHFDTFAKVALGVGEALVGLYVISKVIALVQLLTAAIAANPFGALLVALTVGISLLRQFGDEIKVSGVTIGSVLRAVWDDIKRLGAEIWTFLEGAWKGLTEAFSNGFGESTGGIKMSLRNVLTLLASFVDAAIGMLVYLKDTFITIFTKVPAALGELFIDVARKIASVFETIVNKLIDGYNYVHAKLDSLGAPSGVGLKEGRDAQAKKTAEEQAAILTAVTPHMSSLLNPMTPQEQAAEIERARALRQSLKLYIGPGFENNDAEAAWQTKTGIEQITTSFGGLSDKERATVGLGHGVTDREAAQGARGYLEHQDFSFKNVLAGSEEALGKAMRDDIDKAIHTNYARKYIDDVFDRAAKDDITSTVTKKDAYVSDAHGPKDPASVDDKGAKAAARAYAELERQWLACERAASPLEAANLKLEKAFDVGAKALGAGIASFPEFMRVIRETAALTDKARHPMEAWQKTIADEVALLGLSTSERERSLAIRKAEDERRKEGIVIGIEEIKTITSTIDAQRTAIAMANWTRETRFGANNSAYDELQRRRTDFGAGVERGMNEIGAKIQDVASLSQKALTDAFQGAEDALVKFVTTGKLELSSLLQMLEQDLARLLIRQGTNALFGAGGLDWLPHPPGSGSTPSGAGGAGGYVYNPSAGDTSLEVPSERRAPPAIHIHMDPKSLLSVLPTDEGQQMVTNIVVKQNGSALATRDRLRARS